MANLPLEILEALAVLLATMLIGIDAARLFRGKEELRKKHYEPKTLIIIPCKGPDLGLGENLISIKKQRYLKYDVVAVIDSEDDPAATEIRKAGIKHIISSVKSARASGKVRAIASALSRFRNYEAYVVADSDIMVNGSWLSSIVAPLADKRIGIATTYPHFVPIGGFWSKVKMVWNFVGENLLENRKSRFAWGGTMAFRKDLVKDSIHYFVNSRYSVSDDITLTKICKSKKLGIAYVKEAQPMIRTKDNPMQFAEWANRQTALTLLGYPNNFRRGIFFYFSEIFVLISGAYLSATVSPTFILLFAHLLTSLKRSYARTRTKDPMIAAIVLLMPFIYLYNLVSARMMKRIVWRGSSYKLVQ